MKWNRNGFGLNSEIDVSKFPERLIKVKTLERQFLEIDTTREIIHDN